MSQPFRVLVQPLRQNPALRPRRDKPCAYPPWTTTASAGVACGARPPSKRHRRMTCPVQQQSSSMPQQQHHRRTSGGGSQAGLSCLAQGQGPGVALDRYVLLTGVVRPLTFSAPEGSFESARRACFAGSQGPFGCGPQACFAARRPWVARVSDPRLRGSVTPGCGRVSDPWLPALQGLLLALPSGAHRALQQKRAFTQPRHARLAAPLRSRGRPRLPDGPNPRPHRSTTKRAHQDHAKTRSWYTHPALSVVTSWTRLGGPGSGPSTCCCDKRPDTVCWTLACCCPGSHL